MTIPDYQSIMYPLLRLAGDNNKHHIHEATEQLADEFVLSVEEKSELLPSGTQSTFYNRVGWARTYLLKAGLLTSPERGFFQITERGRDSLKTGINRIDNTYLQQFPEFIEFRRRRSRTTLTNRNHDLVEESLTPEEEIENVYQRIRNDLADDLLEYILKSPPGFFEKLVIDLLVSMGYGGTHKEAARAVGHAGDEGIDGIIDEDRLGLDSIYIQAKRWQPRTPVGRPLIQEFVGALQGRRAKRGIYITTSYFTNEAKEYAKNIDTKIVLIDGDRLTDLMIDFGVGVSTRIRYDIKEVDTDYFSEIIG